MQNMRSTSPLHASMDRIRTFFISRQGAWRGYLTRTRVTVFALTLIAVGLALGGLDPTPSEHERYSEPLALELPPRLLDPAAETQATEVATAMGAISMPASLQSTSVEQAAWEAVSVRSGQTLGEIFREQDFSLSLMNELLALNEDTQRLVAIRPGDRFEFQRHADGRLARMRFAIDDDAYLVVQNGPDGLRADRLERQVYRERHEAQGRIESSLFLAAKAAGLSDNMTMELANIFGWDIDFVFDIRAGDRFFIIYEKVYRDGEYLRDGNILAATFVNQGERYRALRFEQNGLGEYYTPEGRPMRKAFLRAPLNFARISSNFNPKRFHPVLKRVKPHRGIDYAAPVGTPVYAAGNGRVTRSGYDKYNGHHVFIQHSESIVTKYLHFTRRAVKKNQTVKQGEVIGYLGGTGMVTAPHLHYEFVVNGVHRNPRTVPLPEAKPLTGQELASFQANVAGLQNQLGRLESASLYASRE